MKEPVRGARHSATSLHLTLVAAAVILCAALLHAGGPLKVAGVSWFHAGMAGTPLTWPQGAVRYYTDQGDLSPLLPQGNANAFVADAFQRWTSVPTAALSAVQAGQLNQDVNGANVISANGQLIMPADIQPDALGKPVAIVYDAGGQVTDALLGQGAGAADLCDSNAVYGGPDNYTADAHLAHALVVINGNCAQTLTAVADLKYHLIRVLGRVLGLDWADLNGNVVAGFPPPTADDFLGFPVMHALEPACPLSTMCFAAADQLKMDDRAAISRLYPVTSANVGNFTGKQIFSEATARVRGTIYFRGRDGLPAQPMQGVKVVARWVDPGTGLPSRRYAATSISGFLFRGNAGNPATGYLSPGGERYDKFGSNDPAWEGYFDLAGLEFPAGGTAAQYQITVEAVDPSCTEPGSVGPYRSGQVAPSGLAAAVSITLTKGSELTRDFLMTGSALPAGESAGTFAAPVRLPASGYWAGSLSPYGNADYYWFAGHADRSLTVKITALDEKGRATQQKAEPVIGIWRPGAMADSAPDASASYFTGLEPGTTVLSARLLAEGKFKLGIADFRGDGRPDFRYRARFFYGDSLSPTRVPQTGATLTVRGIGLDAATTAKIGGKTASVVAAAGDRIVLAAPSLPNGIYNADLQAADGATSSLVNALTYGAITGDKIVLLQGAGNPATPVGGEAPNPLRVRVLQADGLTPVAGATVTFSCSKDGVVFSACGTTACALPTDEQGEASSRMVPAAVGTFTVRAAISAATYVTADLVGQSSALDISALSQSAWVAEGASGSVPLTVRVLSYGQPVGAASVQYEITQGSGVLSASTALTDSSGYATVNLNLTGLASQVEASACVLPDVKPCANFHVYKVSSSNLRLQFVAGEQQIINTAQSFAPVRLRVVEVNGLNPVRMAPVTVLSAVFRWQAPVPASVSVPPPAPVLLASSGTVAYSNAAGMISFTPSPAARFGAVVVKVIASAANGYALQFELQRLWAPPGVTQSTESRVLSIDERRQLRITSSPRYRPTH